MKERLTIAEAALLTRRHKSRIYRWIDAGKLQTRKDADGRITVDREALTRVEREATSGRPKTRREP